MKFFLLTLIMLSVMPQSARSQWYHRHYGADNLRDLSFYQLKESSKRSVINIGIGTFSMAAGSMIMITGREKLDPLEDVSFIDIFQSPDAVGYAIAGAAAFTAGAVVVLTNIARLVMIGSARNKMFAMDMYISPALMLNNYSNNISPGVSVTITF
ncbi:MAG TPA: hypothetical protein VMW76_04415 [Bacteroidales bacterium]|nr:hypothetical protein [Bacteroidales bacterium]